MIVIMSGKGNRCSDCRLVMLGSTGVGKSALVVRFLTKRFIWEYDPTLECTYRHQALVDEESISSEILDTAGQNEDGICINEGHVRWGDGFILVYSITDRDTFLEIQQMKQQLDEIKRPKSSICALIGNKTDLEHQRCVSTEEAEKLAADMCCAFFETSACNGDDNINEAFHEIFREVKRRKIMDSKPRRRSSASQMKQAFNKMFTKIQNG